MKLSIFKFDFVKENFCSNKTFVNLAFMLTDMNYQGTFFGPNDSQVIVTYPVLFPLFILYGVTLVILVTNLLIGK
jgi:hypothetical protein